jgi:ribosomal protein S25
MVDKSVSKQEMVDKWSIKPSLAEKLADILDFVADKEEFTTGVVVQHFGFPTTSAKRYLRHLTEFGYLKAFGGNKNRTYRKRSLDYSL